MSGGLERLVRDIRACRICREAPRFPPKLPHEPRPVLRVSPGAKILIAGQAPGTKVHTSGKPYTDPSGVRLRQWLGTHDGEFYDAARVAIVPMGFCFPGQDANGADLPPRRECAVIWHDNLMARLPAVELVLAIGRYSQVYHMTRLGLRGLLKPSLTDTMAHWREIWDARAAPRVLPLPHPSWRNTGWLKRNPWFAAELVPELRATVRRLLA
jgi:uracil-DNA glycosylase